MKYFRSNNIQQAYKQCRHYLFETGVFVDVRVIFRRV
jgi:hypothetical protein